ncbi:MAG TPA: hypothetical protein VGE22_12150 [Solimonas sp.]
MRNARTAGKVTVRLFEFGLVAFFVAVFLLARSLAVSAADADAGAAQPAAAEAQQAAPAGDDFDFFSDQPVESAAVVELPPEKPLWLTVGGPLVLIVVFFLILAAVWWFIPFDSHSVELNLRELPPAAKRGIAMAVVMFGIAFCFGASEIWYQLRLHGTAQAYFEQMSLGKLIAFTHAHLFGFTTCFFIIGIPFSMQFNQLQSYQWIFPVGLAASMVDVMSWWGIKYVAPSFEWVSMFCGILFSFSYLFMLVGLLRVLLFPDVIWRSDKDRAQRLQQRAELREAAKHHEGDY